MKPFRMALPRSVEEASRAGEKSFRRTQLLAGGTDLLGELKERTVTPDLVVNLKRIPGLNSIQKTDQGLEIGALCTLTEVAEHAEVRAKWPALAATIARTATPQLRNVGTIGGNLAQRPRCWYYRHEQYACLKKRGAFCYAANGENRHHSIFENQLCSAPHVSNTAPVLMAYDASLEIAGGDGRREIALEEFFISPMDDVTRENVLAPGEVITKVILPAGSAAGTCVYRETREKQSYDWASAGATVRLRRSGSRVEEARVVLSAVAPRPIRRQDLEAQLVGKDLTDARIAEVCNAAVAPATPLKQNGYKVQLVRTMLQRALTAAGKE